MLGKYILFFLLTFIPLLATHTLVCVGTPKTSLPKRCTKDDNHTKIIRLSPDATYDTSIFTIQTKLRTLINQDENISLALLSQGMSGTLTAIAQNNLLPYYREHIKGLIVKDSPAILTKMCSKKTTKTIPKPCQNIKKLNTTLQEKASLDEVTKALSPALQMDWYYPEMLLADTNSTNKNIQHESWINALENNGIPYRISKKFDTENIDYFIKMLPSFLKLHQTKIPQYYGPILRFHIGKILYASKRPVQVLSNIPYGKSNQQNYDVYFENNRSNNPLLIYVHGGGWTKGDKSSFADFSKQYANKGYTVVSLNYRYLHLPQVGMKEMISDVKSGIEKALHNATIYHANPKKVVVMGESAGAQLLFMAVSKLDKNKISVAIFNSMTTSLYKHSEKKQQRLSGIKDAKQRKAWLNAYSPISHLNHYYTPTLVLHSLDDKVVSSSHLQVLDLQSVIYNQNITPLWISYGAHPLAPDTKSMQLGYQDIEKHIDAFIAKILKNI